MSAQVAAALRMIARCVSDPDRAGETMQAVPDGLAAMHIQLARTHGVEAWLAGQVPHTRAWQPLAEQRLRFIAARARARAELTAFATIADRLGCAWVAVKGQAVGEDLYPSPELRHGVDIDVLVAPHSFPQLVAALLDDGWQLLDRNWPVLEQTVPAQLRLVSPSGGLFDVHWNLMNNPLLRRDFPLPTLELLDRRRTLPSGLPALDRTDQLVHLAVHGALSGGNRLMWLVDVGLAANRVPDWSVVSGAARRAGAGMALALMLLRAQRWLGSAAPVAELGSGAGWRAVCRAADRLAPLAADPDRPGPSRSLARSARAGQLATSREFGRHLLGYVRSGLPSQRPPSPLRNPNDPTSPLFDSGDLQARQRYFELAATG